jgi:DNA-binding transcriptional LysR family regulator
VLNIGQLHVLSAVAEQGSMSGAAALLSYTPSAVSQKIAALEREVGIGLVERGAHGTSLTEAGRTLVRHTREIFASLADAEEELEELAASRTVRLRLGAFPTAAAVLAPYALTAFRNDHPAVDVSIWEVEPEDAVAKLHAREIDLALVYEFPAVPGSVVEGVDCGHLFDEPLYVAVAQGHRLAHRDHLKLSEFAGEAWIRGVPRDSPAVEILPAICRANGFEPRIVLQTDDHVAVQGCVAAGLGVALVPRLTLPIIRRDVALCALDEDSLTRRVGLAVAAGSYRSSSVTSMTDILEHICRGLPEQFAVLDDARRVEGVVDGLWSTSPQRRKRRETLAGLQNGA